jgi:hypothetical protein
MILVPLSWQSTERLRHAALGGRHEDFVVVEAARAENTQVDAAGDYERGAKNARQIHAAITRRSSHCMAATRRLMPTCCGWHIK